MTRPLRDLIIYCDRVSNAATTLAKRAGARRCVANPRHKLRRTDGSLIINYGSSVNPTWLASPKTICLNPPQAVSASISKVTSYERFKANNIPTVEFTTDPEQAGKWLLDGQRVLARRDRLSSGNGISILEGGGTPGNADFWSKYFKKTHEYRVHVFRTGKSSVQGEAQRAELDSFRVIDITQKKRTTGDTGQGSDRSVLEKVVRSLDNGWVHAHENIHLPDACRESITMAAITAVQCLGLDFGAVDIIAQFGTKNAEKLYGFAVLEVNTAPGLRNEVTIKAYADAIKELYESTRGYRALPVPVRRPKRVRKLVKVKIRTRKGNLVYRERYRLV